jgi:hypothetical protein
MKENFMIMYSGFKSLLHIAQDASSDSNSGFYLRGVCVACSSEGNSD